MAKGKRTTNRRAKDFSRLEIFEICSKYGSELETSMRALAEANDTSEVIIAKLLDRGIIEGVVTMEIALRMRKTAMYNARRGAADWAESELRKAFRKKFDTLSKVDDEVEDAEEQKLLVEEQKKKLEEEREQQIAERRAETGQQAASRCRRRYQELFAKRATYRFSDAEEREIFITLVESMWPKSIYSEREFIALDVLEVLLERVIGNPDVVEDRRVLQYQELYITPKASSKERDAFERGMTQRNLRKIESVSGKAKIFREFLEAKADKEKFLADRPWLTSKKFAECLTVSIITPDATTDEEVAKCVKLVTKRNNTEAVRKFFQNLISQRKANAGVPVQGNTTGESVQLTVYDVLPKN